MTNIKLGNFLPLSLSDNKLRQSRFQIKVLPINSDLMEQRTEKKSSRLESITQSKSKLVVNRDGRFQNRPKFVIPSATFYRNLEK